MDGAEFVRWAWILVGLGPEDAVNDYIEWYRRNARGRRTSSRSTSATWRIALAMRSGRPFAEITGEIMADVAASQEAMPTPTKPAHATPAKETSDTAAPWQHDEPPNRTPRQQGQGKGGKGNKGKGKSGRKDNIKTTTRARARNGPIGTSPGTTPDRATSRTRLPWVVRWGDITKDSADEVARLSTDADPSSMYGDLGGRPAMPELLHHLISPGTGHAFESAKHSGWHQLRRRPAEGGGRHVPGSLFNIAPLAPPRRGDGWPRPCRGLGSVGHPPGGGLFKVVGR